MVISCGCLLTRSVSAYISNRRLLLSLADAGERLMYAYKDLVEVAGLTGRYVETNRDMITMF